MLFGFLNLYFFKSYLFSFGLYASVFYFYRAGGLIPTRFKRSTIKVCLIFLSKSEDEQSEGQTLTSISQAFNLESMRISNPYS